MGHIEVDGSRIEYLEQGQGEPVLLLHSSASSGAQWRSLAARLAGRYRVLAPDLYGYGASAPWPGRAPLRLAHEAGIVRALLERAGEPAHLVGHSYGGAVALHVARTQGDRLRSLTLFEPVAFHLLADWSEIAAVADGVARAVEVGDYMGGMARFVEYWSGPGAWEAVPAARRAAMAARLPKVALDFHATFSEPVALAQLRAVAVPTLLLQGTRSPQPVRHICRLLAATLPAVRLRAIEGVGHMAPLTHPDTVNPLIAAHLDACAETTRLAA